MKVLVCGGRDFEDWPLLSAELDKLKLEPYKDLIIEGGAKGADTLAHDYAVERRIPCLTCHADWSVGRQAGYYRNSHMLTYGPDIVIAFPGGRGTANMVSLAKKAGVEVIEIAYPSDEAGPEHLPE